MLRFICVLLLALALIPGCRAAPSAVVPIAEQPTVEAAPPTSTPALTTPTSTVTRTLTASPLPLSTATSTPLEVSSHTATPTPSPTRTARPTETLTPRPSPTQTATPSPSHTPTRSPTVTPSPQSTATSTLAPIILERPLIIGVDPGHGGRDLGARHFGPDGRMDFYESQIILDIALRLAQLLEEQGYGVFMTRDGDYFLNDVERRDVNEDGKVNELDQLQLRVDLLNAAKVDLFVSIHLNAYEGEGYREIGGTTTYYCAAREFSDQSLHLAQLVQKHTLASLAELGYQASDRGIRTDLEAGAMGEHMILLGPPDEECIRPSQMPGALSESLFITNEEEAKLMQQESVRQALARALLTAINAYVAETGLSSDGD